MRAAEKARAALHEYNNVYAQPLRRTVEVSHGKIVPASRVYDQIEQTQETHQGERYLHKVAKRHGNIIEKPKGRLYQITVDDRLFCIQHEREIVRSLVVTRGRLSEASKRKFPVEAIKEAIDRVWESHQHEYDAQILDQIRKQ
jgi:hypothetical protein